MPDAGTWRFGHGLCAVSTAALLATQGPAAAQENEDASFAPEDITIFATKSPITAFEYPGEVTVVPRDVILDFNPSTIADIFAAVPGARFDGGPRRTGQVPSIRGLSGEGVLVLFDGARQNFLSGHDGRFFIDPDLLKSAEVIRGPSSALYGSSALGGVIALRTIDARDILNEGDSFALRASAGFQSANDEARGSGLVGWASNDGRADIIASLTYRNSGDIALGNGLDLPADDASLSSLIKGTYRAANDLDISLSWQRFDASAVDPNNPQGSTIAGPGNGLVDRDIQSNTVQSRIAWAPSDNDWIDADLTIYHSRNTVEEAELNSDRIIDRRVKTTGFLLNNRSRFDLGGAGVTLTYGGEVYSDHQTGRDNTTVDGSRGGVPDARTTFYGAFLQADIKVDEPLGLPGQVTLLPALRWDKFDSRADGLADASDSAVSPKIGLSYAPRPEVLLFANWAEAFRAPSFNEVYADGIHFQIPNLSAFPPFPPQFVTNFFVENPGLLPEESATWEIGAGLTLEGVMTGSDSLQVKGSYFRSKVDNLIDLEVNIPAGCFGAPFPPCGSGQPFDNISRNVNVTNARLSGVEVELFYDSDLVYVRANFSAINGRNRDTHDFVGVLSPNLFFADTGVKFLDGDLRLGTRLIIARTFDEVNDPAQRRSAYEVADLYAVWQPSDGPLKGIRVDVGADNITDTNYEVVNAGVSQPGRNLKLTVAWQLGF